jgi:hypothetical protein
LKNAFVAFFNLAKRRAKLAAARKMTTRIVILASRPCDDGLLSGGAGQAV